MSSFKPLDRNSDAFSHLCYAADKLNEMSESGIFYAVEDCYRDFGAGIVWTTIIAYQRRRGEDRSWQVLYPPEHELITTQPSIEEVSMCIQEIHDRQERIFGNRKGY